MAEAASKTEITGAEWITSGRLYLFDAAAQRDPKTWIYFDVAGKKELPILRSRAAAVMRKVEGSKKLEPAIAEYIEWRTRQAEIPPKKKRAAAKLAKVEE